YNTRKVQRAILDGFHSFRPIEKSLALKTLCTHESGAMEVIQDIKSGKMAVDDLDASSIRLMRQYSNPIISKELEARWGTVTQSDSSQSKQIELFKKVLTPATIRDANLVNGQRIYSKRCSNCHTFFGQGGKLGPDLTGAQRTNTAYLLENIIAPHSTVPNAFLLQIIQTVDGRLLSGIVESQTPDSLTLVNENQRSVIPVNQIEQRKTTRESIMPTGLINGLSEKEVRDLIAYLQR
ncbi:c-type cytochrome, partial [Rhodopirellula sp.]